MRAVPIELRTLRLMNNRNTSRARLCKQHFESWSYLIAPDPQFSHAEIGNHRVQAVEMVVMRVRERDNVKLLQPARPQIRRFDFFANINSRAIAARPFRAGEAAAVNQHCPAIRERGENRISLPDVEDSDFKLAAFEMRREGMSRDQNGERAQGNSGSPFRGANRRSKLPTRKACGSEWGRSARGGCEAD